VFVSYVIILAFDIIECVIMFICVEVVCPIDYAKKLVFMIMRIYCMSYKKANNFLMSVCIIAIY
jgi:hypothetical protein